MTSLAVAAKVVGGWNEILKFQPAANPGVLAQCTPRSFSVEVNSSGQDR